MGWSKREAVTNMVYLGDAEGNQTKIGGLLVGLVRDTVYPDKTNYVLVQRDGEEVTLSGSATLARQIGEQDVGKFLKCEFTGWGKSANGKFKVIDVNVWEGAPDEKMKAWPRYAEFANGAMTSTAKANSGAIARKDVEEVFDGTLEPDDDLPF